MKTIKLCAILLFVFSWSAFGEQYFPAVEGGVATSDNATSLLVNPAGLGVGGGVNLSFSQSVEDSLICNSRFYLKVPIFSFHYQRYKLTDNLKQSRFSFGWGTSFLLESLFSGFSLNWYRLNQGEDKKGFSLDSGIMWRPNSLISLGFVTRNLTEPVFGGHKLSRSYTFGVGFRPATDRITASLDLTHVEDTLWEDIGVRVGLDFEPLKGIHLLADVDRDKNFSVGLSFNLTHNQLSYARRMNEEGDAYFGEIAWSYSSQDLRTIIKPHGKAVEIYIGGKLRDKASGFSLLGTSGLSASTIVAKIEDAAEDSAVGGLFLDIAPISDSFTGGPDAMVWEITQALEKFSAAGKPIVAYMKSLAGASEYMIASCADKIVMPPDSSWNGLSGYTSIMRITGLAEKLGIEMEYETVGDYKSTFHQLGPELTEEQREEVISLLEGDREIIVDHIQKMRGFKRTVAEEAYEVWVIFSEDALELGYIDQIGSYEEAKDLLAELMGKESVSTSSISLSNDYRYRWGQSPIIAVVEAYGTIISGESGKDLIFGTRYAGGETISRILEKLSRDNNVKGVVLRIDSGGGSVLGSSMIYVATERFKESGKPIVASMGNMAASGGYFIACNTDRIFASPSTITGSIGVVHMKPVIEDLLEKIAVEEEILKLTEHADIYSPLRHYTEKELERTKEHIGEIYRRFLQNVADGRGMTYEQVEHIAEGRVYTGTQAMELGLIDEFGGTSAAVDYLKAQLGLGDETEVRYYGYREPFFQRLLSGMSLGLDSIFGGGSEESYWY